MAAADVDESGNGYTSRPMTAGKVEFSQQQIMEFANFARRKLIAVSLCWQGSSDLCPSDDEGVRPASS